MPVDESLIEFKSNAWKSTSMVAGYAERMHETRGTNRLKNAVEVALCAQYITGKRIIDVGIGTGRGSLPLARAGYDVLGIDISQAMLDQCKREAGSVPIDLRAGDLLNLPVENEWADSLISLNVAVHFPNWGEALADWSRVVKPGGRLVFDVHSFDHLRAVGAYTGCAPEELLTVADRTDAARFMLRTTAEEVARVAESLGLHVVALVPYAAVLGGGNVNYWLRDSRLHGYLGDRALSWMGVDDALLDFGSFIESEVVAQLSTSATGRFMIVLEKRPDAKQTAAVLARHGAIDRIFAEGATLDALRPYVDGIDTWAAKLALHLKHAPNRALLAMALSSPQAALLRPLLASLLDEPSLASAFDAHERQAVDAAALRLVSNLHGTLAESAHFTYAGVDFGAALDYDLMKAVLDTDYFSNPENLK